MSDEYPRQIVRCTIDDHAFDFNQDLGAVEMGRGAACTPCMDRLFKVGETLYPTGERPQRKRKPVLLRAQ